MEEIQTLNLPSIGIPGEATDAARDLAANFFNKRANTVKITTLSSDLKSCLHQPFSHSVSLLIMFVRNTEQRQGFVWAEEA